MRPRLIVMAVAATLAAVACLAQAEKASVLLDKGIYTEETLGNPSAAIGIYSQVVASGEADRQYAAQAQYRIAMCHLKLKHDNEAREALKTFLSKYSDQEELASKARTALEDLLEFDPAALMPPTIVAYVEVGSPGKQLETVLKMLKGTPLANPLEMMNPTSAPSDASAPSATSAPATSYGRPASPAQVFSALLNPSMLKEFKKLRSMAVGVSEIKGRGQSPFVAVLRPGDSDALRGILTAGVLASGQPTAPIEGMQTVQLSPEMACAFDDSVFLFASPVSQLAWSVHQYKSGAPEPSLLTANESFSRLAPAADRKNDALTVWANPSRLLQNKAYIPPEALEKMMIANAFADFENMEGAVVRLRLKETSLSLEATVAYREGRKAFGYDLIRTCPLDQAGFAAVPPQAVGIVALALLEHTASTEPPVADVRQETVRRITGLDLGRELFSNIEQLSLFLMPSSEAATAHPLSRLSVVAPSLGLAITSRNPAQTLAVLDRMLTVQGLMSAGSTSAPAADEQGMRTYVIGASNQKPISLCVAQKGKTTVLAFLPEVVQTSLTALGTGKNVTTDGPMAQALGQVSDKNKVVLVNAGGLFRLYDASVAPPAAKRDAASQPATDSQAVADQIASALDDTVIRLETSELPNTMTVRAELLGIPPLAKLFPLVMQYQQQRMAFQKARKSQAQPSQERNKLMKQVGTDFLKALQANDEAAIGKLIVPHSSVEAKIKDLLAVPGLAAFRFQDSGRALNLGWVLVYGPDKTDSSAPAILIHLLKQAKSPPPWLVSDVEILPIPDAIHQLKQYDSRATGGPMPAPAPAPAPAGDDAAPAENN
ncbi:MAG: tetratricopeptide repeat protein [Phycisphaerae bacterium]